MLDNANWYRRHDGLDRWQFWRPLRSVETIEGEKTSPDQPVMRRRVNGQWEYRAPTAAEIERYLEIEAW